MFQTLSEQEALAIARLCTGERKPSASKKCENERIAKCKGKYQANVNESRNLVASASRRKAIIARDYSKRPTD